MKKLIFLFLFLFPALSFAQQKLEIHFDFNRFEINTPAKFKLDSLVTNQKNIQIIKIHGYADKVDSNKYNDSLSLKRARKIQEYFKSNNVKVVENAEIRGFGENFKQAKLQDYNRKVVVYYIVKPPIKTNKGNGSENSNFETVEKEETPFDLTEIQQTLTNKIYKAKVGDFIVLENLKFHLNSEILIKESEPIPAILLNILKDNPKLKIDINGHICCNRDRNDVRLSYRRAKFLFDYLIKNGIATARLGYRGFGSARPIYKIPEKNAVEEQANRRIEIEIKEN